MENPGSLAMFLRGKRSTLSPEDTPLQGFGVRRRVPGLRREEVAQLAGVSVAYYTRLEQGHSRRASDEILLALARALQLSVTETEHLLDLGHGTRNAPKEQDGPEMVSSAALSLLAAVHDRPAVILGRRNDVLAWNELGHALIAPHIDAQAPSDPARRPSLPRLLFLDPLVRGMYRDWDKEAADYVAYLRLINGKYNGDADLTRMVGELCVGDEAFAALWADGHVGECVAGTKRMAHPTAGRITVDFQLWAQTDKPDQRLEIYTLQADPSGTAASKLLDALQPGSIRY